VLQEVRYNPLFNLHLAIIPAMLQVASAALAGIGAGWWASRRVGDKYLPDLSQEVVFFLFFNGYRDGLAGQDMADEDGQPGRQMGEAITAIDNFHYIDCFQLHCISWNRFKKILNFCLVHHALFAMAGGFMVPFLN